MANNSSASDTDNAALADSKGLRVSRNAATQTPEMQRHAMMASDSQQPESCTQPQSSSFVVLRVDNQKALSEFEKEARALAIPDVVVEYIKDTCALTGTGNDDPDRDLGESNLGFNGAGNLSRSPSSSSLKNTKNGHSRSGSVTSRNANHFEESNGQDIGLLPIAQSQRLYHSMPRNLAKKRLLEDFRMHSQPSSPRLARVNLDGQFGASSSSINLYAPNGTAFVAPPSPSFGYRPLESETSAVYTIIKTCVNTNDIRGIHFVPSVAVSEKSTPGVKRKFEFVPTPPSAEKNRRRLQCLTDACSLLFFLLGFLMVLLTPIFIIPMFMYPISYFLELVSIFIASGALAAAILFLSGFIGNMVWYYDDKKNRLRLKLHCGTGPLRHFWGNGFYSWVDAAREKEHKSIVI